ncbi:MAG: hypothetical protein ABSA16_16645 [Thermoguttaceae bacterium]
MKPSDLFGVVVRTLGLLLLMGSLWLLFWAFLNLVMGGPGSTIGLMITAIPPLFVGVYFLGGAKGLVYLTYQDEFEKRE